ncbi:hypothetical protein BKA64DRAFT_707819 [Cadophora sp. MPI-SDFR-AT-0126]|nr:hypothetical protein BKA64DRAFT_707819 [Leotiomycetes sp. MPI-SDFR-AT-0126]
MRNTRSASKRADTAEEPSTSPSSANNDIKNNPINVALTSFMLFPKLPLEIRQMTWVLSLESRIIEICLDDASGFYSKSKLPPALQVSKESRDTVTSRYKLCFGSTWYPAQTLFNFDLDTLYFDRSMVNHTRLFFGSLRDFELANLQTVAIDMYVGEVADFAMIPYDVMDGICKSLQAMPKLTALLAVYELQHDMSRNMRSIDMGMDLKWMESDTDMSMIQLYGDVPDEFDAYLRRNKSNYFGFDNMIPEWPFYGDYDDFPFFIVYGMRRETKERIIQRNLAETSGTIKTSSRGRRERQTRA